MKSSFAIQFYRYLIEKGEMDLYQWHQTTQISPIEMAAIVREEIAQGRILLNNERAGVILTEYGRQWIEANKEGLFAEEKEEGWKYVPNDMKYRGDKLFDSLYDSYDLQKLIDNL